MSRFEESSYDFAGRGDVESIDENRLVLCGGGDFYEGDNDSPDDETRAKAEVLAAKYGMRITSAAGSWWGYSEYTPDPGDVSIFEWERISVIQTEAP